MKLIKDSIITFSSRILIMILGIIPGIIIARVLGPEGKGEFALLLLVTYFFYAFFKGGVEVANVYYVSSKSYSPKEVLSSSLSISLILGFLGVGIFFFTFPFLQQHFLKGINPLYFFIIIWEVPILIMTRYLQNIILGLGQIVKYNSIEIFSTALMIILVPIFVLGLKFGVMGAVISSIIAVVLTVLIALSYLKEYIPINPRINFKVAGNLLSYGIKGHLGEVVDVFYSRLDMIMISYFLGVQFVGFYSVALIVERIWYIPFAIGIVLFPKISSLSLVEANRLSRIICRNTVLITTALSLLIFVTSPYFIPILYGGRFLPALKPLWVLLPGIIFLSVAKILKSYLLGRAKPFIATRASVFAFAVNFILNYLLIPRWGMIGGAFATSCSYLIYAGLILLQYVKISKNSIAETLVIKREDLALYLNLFSQFKHAIIKNYK